MNEPRTRSELTAAVIELNRQINAFKKPHAAYLVEGWDDIRIPGLSVERGAAAPGLGPWLAAGGLEVLRFDGVNTLEQVFFVLQMPHSFKLGSTIVPHVHWGPVDNAAGDVIWNLEVSLADMDAVFTPAAIIQVTDTAAGVAWTHQYASFGEYASIFAELSGMIVCRLYRDPALAGDTYGSDAGFLEIDLHYRLDTIGSRAELVK